MTTKNVIKKLIEGIDNQILEAESIAIKAEEAEPQLAMEQLGLAVGKLKVAKMYAEEALKLFN